MGQRQEDFLGRSLPLTHCSADTRVATWVTMLITQTMKDARGRVTLLLWGLSIGFQDLVEDG
ncbi:hypothetical protein HG15A2_36960 [Adhaeretor mobilis]|uniref:Uncharacterized protein n=1 Tax=Adhaeretor mobilis TaxID=1930276 RepID=A0A517MZP9_9BACT|nr:hypothetical protein HG15A2_36960 [Adhaeretor mobilis]